MVVLMISACVALATLTASVDPVTLVRDIVTGLVVFDDLPKTLGGLVSVVLMDSATLGKMISAAAVT